MKVYQTKNSLIYRIFSCFLSMTFILSMIITPTPVSAQSVLNLPVPGTMVASSAAFRPPMMAGMTIDPQNPLQFNFIISGGDDNIQGQALAAESQKLINYFLATLTVPEDEMWVNLSPYERNRIVADGLSQTEMGRDMLSQDYILKQFTASLMYPEESIGAKFWQKVKEKTVALYGDVEIPTNTFNKVWIIPEKASVYVHGANVFVAESYLKVMLEEDYVAQSHDPSAISQGDVDAMSVEAKEVIREIIIPEIEREVNEGKNFSNLRQIYNSMILATWYKKNLRESILGKIYMDANKVDGINIDNAHVDQIYSQYVEAFKKGVYDFIKEDYDPVAQEVTQKKYFSGGLTRVKGVDPTGSAPMVIQRNGSAAMSAVVLSLDAVGADGAMSSVWSKLRRIKESAKDLLVGESAAEKELARIERQKALRAEVKRVLGLIGEKEARLSRLHTLGQLDSEEAGQVRGSLRELNDEKELLDGQLGDGTREVKPQDKSISPEVLARTGIRLLRRLKKVQGKIQPNDKKGAKKVSAAEVKLEETMKDIAGSQEAKSVRSIEELFFAINKSMVEVANLEKEFGDAAMISFNELHGELKDLLQVLIDELKKKKRWEIAKTIATTLLTSAVIGVVLWLHFDTKVIERAGDDPMFKGARLFTFMPLLFGLGVLGYNIFNLTEAVRELKDKINVMNLLYGGTNEINGQSVSKVTSLPEDKGPLYKAVKEKGKSKKQKQSTIFPFKLKDPTTTNPLSGENHVLIFASFSAPYITANLIHRRKNIRVYFRSEDGTEQTPALPIEPEELIVNGDRIVGIDLSQRHAGVIEGNVEIVLEVKDEANELKTNELYGWVVDQGYLEIFRDDETGREDGSDSDDLLSSLTPGEDELGGSNALEVFYRLHPERKRFGGDGPSNRGGGDRSSAMTVARADSLANNFRMRLDIGDIVQVGFELNDQAPWGNDSIITRSLREQFRGGLKVTLNNPFTFGSINLQPNPFDAEQVVTVERTQHQTLLDGTRVVEYTMMYSSPEDGDNIEIGQLILEVSPPIDAGIARDGNLQTLRQEIDEARPVTADLMLELAQGLWDGTIEAADRQDNAGAANLETAAITYWWTFRGEGVANRATPLKMEVLDGYRNSLVNIYEGESVRIRQHINDPNAPASKSGEIRRTPTKWVEYYLETMSSEQNRLLSRLVGERPFREQREEGNTAVVWTYAVKGKQEHSPVFLVVTPTDALTKAQEEGKNIVQVQLVRFERAALNYAPLVSTTVQLDGKLGEGAYESPDAFIQILQQAIQARQDAGAFGAAEQALVEEGRDVLSEEEEALIRGVASQEILSLPNGSTHSAEVAIAYFSGEERDRERVVRQMMEDDWEGIKDRIDMGALLTRIGHELRKFREAGARAGAAGAAMTAAAQNVQAVLTAKYSFFVNIEYFTQRKRIQKRVEYQVTADTFDVDGRRITRVSGPELVETGYNFGDVFFEGNLVQINPARQSANGNIILPVVLQNNQGEQYTTNHILKANRAGYLSTGDLDKVGWQALVRDREVTDAIREFSWARASGKISKRELDYNSTLSQIGVNIAPQQVTAVRFSALHNNQVGQVVGIKRQGNMFRIELKDIIPSVGNDRIVYVGAANVDSFIVESSAAMAGSDAAMVETSISILDGGSFTAVIAGNRQGKQLDKGSIPSSTRVEAGKPVQISVVYENGGKREVVSLQSPADIDWKSNPRVTFSDAAMAPGGIDFNPAAMGLIESGDKINFQMDPAMLQDLNPDLIQGLKPVIINITPIPNYLPLLGYTDDVTVEEALAMAAVDDQSNGFAGLKGENSPIRFEKQKL